MSSTIQLSQSVMPQCPLLENCKRVGLDCTNRNFHSCAFYNKLIAEKEAKKSLKTTHAHNTPKTAKPNGKTFETIKSEVFAFFKNQILPHGKTENRVHSWKDVKTVTVTGHNLERLIQKTIITTMRETARQTHAKFSADVTSE